MSRSQNMTFAATGGFAAVANHLADELADQAHPPAGRFVEIDGVRAHVLEKGAGPPALYLHGNGGMMQEVQATGLVEHISADLEIVVGKGHMLPHVVPEVVMAALSRLEHDLEQIVEAAGIETRTLAPASP